MPPKIKFEDEPHRYLRDYMRKWRESKKLRETLKVEKRKNEGWRY